MKYAKKDGERRGVKSMKRKSTFRINIFHYLSSWYMVMSAEHSTIKYFIAHGVDSCARFRPQLKSTIHSSCLRFCFVLFFCSQILLYFLLNCGCIGIKGRENDDEEKTKKSVHFIIPECSREPSSIMNYATSVRVRMFNAIRP